MTAMTMCLAATAQHAGSPRIVLTADFLASDGYSSYEDVSKYRQISEQFIALCSGPKLRARDLTRSFQAQLKDRSLGVENPESELSAIFSNWMDSRPLDQASRSTQSTEMLISGFIDGEPRIFVASEFQERCVEVSDRYAIGAGSGAAMGMLDWRGLSENSPLRRALYLAYEAKRIRKETIRLANVSRC